MMERGHAGSERPSIRSQSHGHIVDQECVCVDAIELTYSFQMKVKLC